MHIDVPSDLACSARVDVTCKAETMRIFSLLLQHGAVLEAELPSSVRSVLCDQFGVTPDYLTKRINTIFLDGKPVDNVDTALVRHGSVLALSASMPGFVGAAFRKGGYYAAMRGSISHADEHMSELPQKGCFTVKLFNLTSPELGPSFLATGVRVRSEDFGRFLEDRASAFWSGRMTTRLDKTELDPRALQRIKWSDKQGFVLLGVTLAEVDPPD